MMHNMKRVFLFVLGCLSASITLPVFAADAGMLPGSPGMSQILVLVGFILIFYFLMWRPQSQKAKAHRALLESLTKDDEVITTGGILARVIKVTDNFLIVQIAEGIEITVQKNAVAASMPQGTIKSV